MLDALARCVGPNLVAARLCDVARASKSPVVLAAAAEYVGALVTRAGIGRLYPPPLVAFLAGECGLQSTHVPSRERAVDALCALHRQLGPPLLALLGRCAVPPVPERTLSSLRETLSGPRGAYDAASARAILDATVPTAGERVPPTVRLFADPTAAAPPPAGAPPVFDVAAELAEPRRAPADVFSLFPRGRAALLDAMDTPNAGASVTALEDGDGVAQTAAAAAKRAAAAAAAGAEAGAGAPWQVRVEAIQAVIAALEAHAAAGGAAVAPLLANESLTALAKALVRRLGDSSGPIKPRAAAALGALAAAAGPAGALSLVRHAFPPLVELLKDSKAAVAAAALAALEPFVTDAVPADGSGARPAASSSVPANVLAVIGALHTSGALAPPASAAAAASGAPMREALLPFLARHAAAVPRAGATVPPFSQLIPAVLAGSVDRSAKVREGARALLVQVARIVGADALSAAARNLPNADHAAASKAIAAAVAEAAATPRVSAPSEAASGYTSDASEGGGAAAVPRNASARPPAASLKRQGSAAPPPPPGQGGPPRPAPGSRRPSTASSVDSGASGGPRPVLTATASAAALAVSAYSLHEAPLTARDHRARAFVRGKFSQVR